MPDWSTMSGVDEASRLKITKSPNRQAMSNGREWHIFIEALETMEGQAESLAESPMRDLRT